MLLSFVGLYGNSPVANIRPSDLREVRREMIAKGWSRTYVDDQVGRVKRIYKWLVIESLVLETVYRSLSLMPDLRRGEEGVRETKRILTVEDSAVDTTPARLAGGKSLTWCGCSESLACGRQGITCCGHATSTAARIFGCTDRHSQDAAP